MFLFKNWYHLYEMIFSVQFSRSVVSDSLQPHELQHTSPLCPSPTPGVHPNPCTSSWWCRPTILSSVIPFSSCSQSFPASGSFQMNQLLLGGQSIGVSASTSVLPMNIRDWFSLGLSGCISLQSKGLSRVFSSELTLTKMGEINSDDYSTYYCGQESLRRKGVALIVNRSPKCSTWVESQKRQNDLCSFIRQTVQYHSNPSLCPKQWCWRNWSWTAL